MPRGPPEFSFTAHSYSAFFELELCRRPSDFSLSAYFGATLNSFIHVLMYSYYGLSAVPAMRPYLWWKKYITQGQLVQFVLTVIQTSCAVLWPCGFPMGWLYFQICYMLSLIVLFSNFYIKTYKKKDASRWKEHQNGSSLSMNGHTNGNVKPNKARID
ncbi:ELOV5 protein, partial [Polypterus senegalus]